ncbi:MAG: 5-formyltetrahydrofolate cyclo-ligase [Thermoproteota archaeon]|nr:5-formyltetrahydrofolate cyclo-ligase [Thermoproteota archaeon]
MSDSCQKNKHRIRRDLLELRELLDANKARDNSIRIQDRLTAMQEYQSGKIIGSYAPIGMEVETWKIMHHALANKKTLGLPKIEENGSLSFYAIEETDLNDNLVESSRFKLKEPKALEERLIEKLDLLIIPGIAFDTHGYRVGHGFGYYDRYMAQKTYTKSVGLAYDFQILDYNVPRFSYDRKLDILVTENRTVYC